MRHQRREVGAHQHADDVEPQVGCVLVVRREPALRQGAELASFGGGHRLDRMAETGPPPGLHLAEDERLRVPGDDVELALPAAPVAVEHPQTDVGEVGGGDVLAEGAELESGGHPATVPLRRATSGPSENLWTGTAPVDGETVDRPAG